MKLSNFITFLGEVVISYAAIRFFGRVGILIPLSLAVIWGYILLKRRSKP